MELSLDFILGLLNTLMGLLKKLINEGYFDPSEILGSL